jgi:hypothetical protein
MGLMCMESLAKRIKVLEEEENKKKEESKSKEEDDK